MCKFLLLANVSSNFHERLAPPPIGSAPRQGFHDPSLELTGVPDPREAPLPPLVQFLLFSYSFRQKICRIIGYIPTSGVTAPSSPRKILDPSLKMRTHVRVCDGVPDVLKSRKKFVYFSCSYILLTE